MTSLTYEEAVAARDRAKIYPSGFGYVFLAIKEEDYPEYSEYSLDSGDDVKKLLYKEPELSSLG